MNGTPIVVPDVLSNGPETVEKLFKLLNTPPLSGPVFLDMAGVSWIQPYGAVSLHGFCRYLKQLTREPVRFVRLRKKIHAYLRRIDFFTCENDIVSPTEVFRPSDDLSRSPASSTVLELFPIQTQKDVYEVASRGRRILTSWLEDAKDDIDRIVSLVSEACGNVVDHSGDMGMVMIQKYDHRCFVEIELAISDLGKGIRRSLLVKHEDLSDTSSGFIERALAGLSARPGERGGQGLGTIQRIATASGGALYIHSETGSVQTKSTGRFSHNDRPFFPGTQIAITFRSNVRR